MAWHPFSLWLIRGQLCVLCYLARERILAPACRGLRVQLIVHLSTQGAVALITRAPLPARARLDDARGPPPLACPALAERLGTAALGPRSRVDRTRLGVTKKCSFGTVTDGSVFYTLDHAHLASQNYAGRGARRCAGVGPRAGRSPAALAFPRVVPGARAARESPTRRPRPRVRHSRPAARTASTSRACTEPPAPTVSRGSF